MTLQSRYITALAAAVAARPGQEDAAVSVSLTYDVPCDDNDDVDARKGCGYAAAADVGAVAEALSAKKWV